MSGNRVAMTSHVHTERADRCVLAGCSQPYSSQSLALFKRQRLPAGKGAKVLCCPAPKQVSNPFGCTSLFLPARNTRTFKSWAVPENIDSDPLVAVECPVPEDQQPVIELQNLKEALLFNWATLPAPEFAVRLLAIWGVFLLTLGLPVSAVTFNMQTQGLECFVAASIGSLFIVTVTVLRLYLGWAHVGNRLLSATVEYEETGWYDGQIWVKTPQVLMRDRLLGTYTVRPALQRLKTTLVSLAGITAMSVAVLAFAPGAPAETVTPRSAAYSQPTAFRSNTTSSDYWDAVDCFEPWGVDDPRGEGGELWSSGQSSTHSSTCSIPQGGR